MNRTGRWIIALAMVGVWASGCAEGGEIPEDERRLPAIEVLDGQAMDWRLGTGESAQATFVIENQGTGRLDFELENEASWLELSPESGEIEAGQATTITAEATCPIEQSSLETTVRLTHNDGERSTIGLRATAECDILADEQLQVTVAGLPDDQDAAIEVTGPEGFSESLRGSATIGLAGPGEYVVSADTVGGNRRYEPDPTEVTLDVAREDQVEAQFSYTLIPGGAQVAAEGLPSGVSPDLWVESNGDRRDVPDGGGLADLNPGDYVAGGDDVESGGARYVAETMNFVVRSDEVTNVSVPYGVAPGTIEVAVSTVGDVTFEATIDGPDGFSESLDGPTTFEDAPVGGYEVSIDTVSEDSAGNQGLVQIVSGAQFFVQSDETVTVELRAAAPATVVDAGDNGPGTLRQIIADAASGSQVAIAPSLGPIDLSSEIVVDKALNIVGDPDDADIVISASGGRHFRLESGAELTLEGLTLRDGEANKGGAILVESGAQLWAKYSIFEENLADTSIGGAIAVDVGAQAVFEDTIFRDNLAATDGGALAMDSSADPTGTSVQVWRSLFVNNEAIDNGGALFINGDDTAIWESTVAHNTAGADGGGIYIWEDSVAVIGATVTDNTAGGLAGGIFQYGDALTELRLGRSVVVDNTASEFADLGRQSAGDVLSLGYNFVSIDDGGAGLVDGENHDVLGTTAQPLNAQLVSLSDNGGFSRTRQPTSSSPVRAAVPAADCEAIGDSDKPVRYDQRGVARPAGGACNIGAFELNSQRERFENATMSANQYEAGDFGGDNGVQWTYDEVRRTTGEYLIDETGIILRDEPAGSIVSDDISGGISSLSLQLSQAFTGTGTRQVEVLVNGNSLGTTTAFEATGDPPFAPLRFGFEDIDVSGTFAIEVRSVGEGQVVVDNLTWR